jgi:hypothetical protein
MVASSIEGFARFVVVVVEVVVVPRRGFH